MKVLAAVICVAVYAGLLGAAPPRTILRGYTAASSDGERDLEARFADIPSAQNALDDSAAIAAQPHYAGTSGDRELAIVMRDRMRGYGIAAELEPFTARVDTPRRLALELLPPAGASPPPGRPGRKGRKTADLTGIDLTEVGEPTDPATSARGISIPFNSGSGDGDLRAPLVFVNRGLEADYATLARANIDVQGAVALVRYGAEFRGLLAERAQAHGAAGVIFYSDPKDDGAARGLVYPAGPWRPPTAIARGSVGAAVHIPTLPISAANAQLLLASLHGVDGPATWGGALPVAYPLARGPGRVHLVVELNRKLTTLWNTIGVIPGVHGDQSVMLGAHRDAWVYGVGDNGAGVTTMLEVARGLGLLLKGGWRPQRSILIAGWDGEEIGLAGSHAYVQRHLIDIGRGCYAYLNADENITGPTFGADAVAAIAPVILDATRGVADPSVPSATVYDRWAAQTPRIEPRVEIPGGGSDHQSFLGEAGIPIANIGFAGPFGAYHSSYDTLRYATLFSDPAFTLHRTAAQLYGIVALRLADADVVPYTFGGYVAVLRTGLAQIGARAQREGRPLDTASLARAIDALAYAAVHSDPLIARANADIAPRELRAARKLDALAYGANGYASAIFPGILAAFALHDSAALAAAVARSVDALNSAAHDLND